MIDTELQELLIKPQTKVIDVRTQMEFAAGSVVGAINIPLNELPDHVGTFKNEKTPLILCCASGARSNQATHFLIGQGVQNVHNGGSWMDINYLKNK